jgi:hypothetical protein
LINLRLDENSSIDHADRLAKLIDYDAAPVRSEPLVDVHFRLPFMPGLRGAIVKSRWHSDECDRPRNSAM